MRLRKERIARKGKNNRKQRPKPNSLPEELNKEKNKMAAEGRDGVAQFDLLSVFPGRPERALSAIVTITPGIST